MSHKQRERWVLNKETVKRFRKARRMSFNKTSICLDTFGRAFALIKKACIATGFNQAQKKIKKVLFDH